MSEDCHNSDLDGDTGGSCPVPLNIADAIHAKVTNDDEFLKSLGIGPIYKNL